jgi:hypothetical protein
MIRGFWLFGLLVLLLTSRASASVGGGCYDDTDANIAYTGFVPRSGQPNRYLGTDHYYAGSVVHEIATLQMEISGTGVGVYGVQWGGGGTAALCAAPCSQSPSAANCVVASFYSVLPQYNVLAGAITGLPDGIHIICLRSPAAMIVDSIQVYGTNSPLPVLSPPPPVVLPSFSPRYVPVTPIPWMTPMAVPPKVNP